MTACFYRVILNGETVYPKYGLQEGVNILEFCISYVVEAGGYLVQPCWFIRNTVCRKVLMSRSSVIHTLLRLEAIWSSHAGLSIALAVIITVAASFSQAASLYGDPFAPSVQSVKPTAPSAADIAGDPFSASSVQSSASPQRRDDDGPGKKVWWRRWLSRQKGQLESRNRIRFVDGRAISTRQRLWLEGEKGFIDDSLRFFLSASVDVDPAAASLSADHDDIMVDLHELYLTLEGEDIDLLVGRKMVRWGTGDGINPLDLINPLDHRDPLASGRSDNRLPVLLGQGIIALPAPHNIEEITLEMVAVPRAKVNRLTAAGAAWEPQALQRLRAMATKMEGLQFADQQQPENWFTDGKYAMRLAATVASWDIAVISYSGARNNPVFVGERGINGIIITPKHPRISAFGLNFAKGLQRSTLRGELAIKPNYPLQRESTVNGLLPGYSRENMVEGVIGFDRTFALNRYLNLQYFATWIPESEWVQDRRYTDGLTGELSDLFIDDDLKLGISGIIGFSGQGWLIQPYGEYKFGDNWLLAASIFLFTGDDDGSYGQFDWRDFMTLRLRWSF